MVLMTLMIILTLIFILISLIIILASVSSNYFGAGFWLSIVVLVASVFLDFWIYVNGI